MERCPLDATDHALHVQSLYVRIVRTIEVEEVELLIKSTDDHIVRRLWLHCDLANVGCTSVLHVTYAPTMEQKLSEQQVRTALRLQQACAAKLTNVFDGSRHRVEREELEIALTRRGEHSVCVEPFCVRHVLWYLSVTDDGIIRACEHAVGIDDREEMLCCFGIVRSDNEERINVSHTNRRTTQLEQLEVASGAYTEEEETTMRSPWFGQT